MKKTTFAEISLLLLLAGIFTQIGAQLFAILVVVNTLVTNPPSSFEMLRGDYPYDSSIFWDTIPNLTTILFIVALVGNWKTNARKWIITSLTIFIIAAVFALGIVEPKFTSLISNEHSDNLANLTSNWYRLDWVLWFLTFISGVILFKPTLERMN